jgi:GNAT superfamily N-acetyltransferase
LNNGTAGAVSLREREAGDEEYLFALYLSTRDDLLLFPGLDAGKKGELARMQFVHQDSGYKSRYPKASYDVVLVDKEPAGRFYVHHGEGDVRLLDIIIEERLRNRGIGSILLKRLLEEAAGRGRITSLHVNRFSPAVRFYLRHGFAVAGENGPYLFMERKPGDRAA